MNTFTQTLFALAAVCAWACVVSRAAPQYQPPGSDPVHILKQDQDVHPDGYSFDFETSDGTSRQESGQLRQVGGGGGGEGAGGEGIAVQGQYRYSAPDGLVYTVTYVADEHGFQPQLHLQHQQ